MTKRSGLAVWGRRLLLLLGLLVAVSLFFLWYIGVWNIIFPSTQHDTVAPAVPDDLSRPAVLVFSKTNSFRHVDGIRGGQRMLGELGESNQWGVFFTENGAIFDAAELSRFDTVVFLNASGDMLSQAQEIAFQDWLQAGGGWLGIHAAGDGSHAAWQWYMDNLIGAEFTAHIMGPQFQVATVNVEDEKHPVSRDLPASWQHEEEWYSWAASPRLEGFHIVATIDENSYAPMQKIFGRETDLRMDDHPVVWSNCVGAGRSVYTALGHREEAYAEPHFRSLITNALAWTIGLHEGGC